MIRNIFDDCEVLPYCTFEAQTIVASCDRRAYEPVLEAMAALKTYNEYRGKQVSRFVRSHLMAETEGPVVSIRFGREYSPVLYLSMANALLPDLKRLTYRERQRLTRGFLKVCKQELDPDSARVIAPGVIRLWWD